MIRKISVLAVFVSFLFAPFSFVSAASLTSLSDTMSTVKKNTAANHDITFTTPTGITSGQTMVLTFQSDYSIPALLDDTDIDLLDDGAQLPLAASPSGSTWGVVRTSSTVITFTNGTTAVGAGSVVRIKIGTNATDGTTGTHQITNPTSAGSYTLTIGGGTFADSGTITSIIVDDDVVSVSATVGQSLTFSISDNSIGFGTLSTSAARYATGDTNGSGSDGVAHTLAVATNGTSGYTITVQGATLTSGLNSITANGSTPAASSTGTEQFGMYATASGGTGASIDATYSDDATPGFGYDGTASTAATFATGSSATGTTTYSVHYISNIAPTTEAGSYTASLTYVATANF